MSLRANVNQITFGKSVTFQALATDNIRVVGLQLLVDNNPVALNASGLATVILNQLGTVTARAIATDSAGNTGQATTNVLVIDPTDTQAPVVSLNLGALSGGVVTAPTNIMGTASDSNLQYYTLEVAPVSGGEFQEMGRGTSSVTNGVLGKFDPSLLSNDTYRLRLSAFDTGGNGSVVEDTLSVAGELKLGNFRLSFTDLSLPVTGIPITLTRTYDTLTSSTRDDFGYGWRMEFRDTDLTTSVAAPDELQQELGAFNPFKDGTRVYLTLPGGKRSGFTFKPKQVQEIDGVPLGLFSKYFYAPEFVADKGVTSSLSVDSGFIRPIQGTNSFSDLAGRAFNPSDSFFGGKYLLTTKEGIVYEVDAITGDLLTVTDTNGNKLTYTDAGITSSTGQKITFLRDAVGRITAVSDPMGKLIRYQYDANGDLVSVSDRENNTTRFEYNTARPHYLDKIIDPLGRTGVRNEYDEQGRLKKIVDANGKPVEMVYDPANSVQTVKDQLGNATTYEYDTRGNIVTEIDALGSVTRQTFDENNNLLTRTNPLGHTTKYAYDSAGNLTTVTDPLGNVTRYTFNRFGEVLTKTNPLGNTTTYTYDSRGNRLSLTNPKGDVAKYTFDSAGRPTATIDADGKTTRFEYEPSGNVTRQVDALSNETTYTYDANSNQLTETTKVTKPTGVSTLTTQWAYDANNRVTSVTNSEGNIIRQVYDKLGNLTAVVDQLGHRTQYSYDDKGKLVETVYADNTSKRSVYDALGQQIATIDQAGQTTRYTYDANGRLVETMYADDTPNDLSDNPRTHTEYDQVGRTIAQIDERGNRTQYEYDAADRRTLARDALGNKTTYTYNAAGNLLTETNARNYTTRFVYDELGRQVGTRYADGTSTTITFDAVGRRNSSTDQAGNTTYFKYDALNRLIEVIHPDDTPNGLSDNPRNRIEYNELGQVIAEIDELGNRNEYKYDAVGRKLEGLGACRCRRATYTYDAAGNRLTETDPLGRTTRFVYDSLNRPIETRFHDGIYTTTTYDNLGRVIAQTDQALKATQSEYDARGRLTAVVDALGQRTEYKYDAAGNLIQIKDANNRITQYEYDSLNRRTVTILPMGQQALTTYDAVGNVASTTDFNGEIVSYQYDPMNRISAKRFPDTAIVEYTYTPTGQIKTIKDQRGITTSKYDARYRLTDRIDPDGRLIRYTYDAANNRTAVITPTGTTTYTYNQYNQLTSVTDPNGGVTRYTYDQAGNLIRTELPNGTVETRQYNDQERLVYLENTGSTGIISSYRYTLDPAGNRTAVVENTGRLFDYTYDNLYRLTQEKITGSTTGNRTIGYTYDAVGNRLTRNDSVQGLTTYTYDNNDRFLSETLNGQVTNYAYDNNGNTLSRIKNATDQMFYDWDYENRLIEANVTSSTGTVETQYQYNSDGIRVASIVNEQETRYLIDANQPYAQVLEEYTPGGPTQASYVYGRDLISQNRSGQWSFYHTDGLGSTRALTNVGSNVTDTYDYEAYGNLIGSTGSTVNNYRFTGEQYDPNFGYYYLRARYYDPATGRFTTRDPFEGEMTEPLSLAKYPYVHGNPVNGTDPSGLFLVAEQSVVSQILSVLTSLTVPSLAAAGGVLSLSGSSPTSTRSGTENISRTPLSITEGLTLQIARAEIRRCALMNDPNCRTGLPIVVYAAWDLEEHANHINDAQKGEGNTKFSSQGYTPQLSPVLTYGPDQRTGFYENTPQCDEAARNMYQMLHGNRGHAMNILLTKLKKEEETITILDGFL